MEMLERFLRKRQKKELPLRTISEILKSKPTDTTWTYPYFREYLLALGTGSRFLLPIKQYPDLIEFK